MKPIITVVIPVYNCDMIGAVRMHFVIDGNFCLIIN